MRKLTEGLAYWEAKVAGRTEPRTWLSYLPPEMAAGVVGDPTEAFRSFPRDRLPPKGVERLSAADLALINATPQTAAPRVAAEKTPEELFPAAPPPRKKAKVERKRGKSPPRAAPAAPTVSSRSLQALEAVWSMTFGPEKTNPFRTRLTKEACVQLGIPDYHDVVEQVMDLSLLKQRVNANYYTTDEALRVDARLILCGTQIFNFTSI